MNLRSSLIRAWPVVLTLTAHADRLGPACGRGMVRAAQEAEATAREVGPERVRVKYVDPGVTTGVARDNWTASKVTLALEGTAESRIYLVSARQIADSAECHVLSAQLIGVWAPIPDRVALARRLSPDDSTNGMLRALEAIDLEFPELAKDWERLTVEIVEGDRTAALGRPVTLIYRASFGPARVMVVRYVRSVTVPNIQLISESGGPP